MKVKEAIKAQRCNTAGDAADTLSGIVSGMVEKAAARAKAN